MRSLFVAGALAVAVARPAVAQQESAAPAAPGPAAPAQSPPAAAAPGAAAPQDDAEAQRKLEAQIAKELGAPGGTSQPPPAGAGAPGGPGAPAAAPTGANPFARLLLLPDLSAIGSFVVPYDTWDVGRYSPRGGPYAPRDKLAFQFEELELGLQAVVDPYLRADVFISFGEAGVDVEEAYATTLGLPGGLQLRAGKFFSPFGRMNQQHPHVWEFVDAPLARSRLLATETLSGPGVDLAWLAPVPWFAELQLAGQSTAPEQGNQSRLTAVARLLQYVNLGDATTAGLGLSAARRDEQDGGGFRDLGGADVYVKIRPPEGRAYLTLSSELYARRFRGVAFEPTGTDVGWWAQAFYRKDAWWGYGLRYEQAPAEAPGAGGDERRAGAVAAWFPSEFERVRLQLSYARLPGGRDGLEALLHLEFGIGAHGAHPF